jgi:hypothetical protein
MEELNAVELLVKKTQEAELMTVLLLAKDCETLEELVLKLESRLPSGR